MKRVLKYLFASTLLAPFAAGTAALIAGFGDPWGMGNKDPVGIFFTAALPVLPPGILQVLTWPATYGLALLASPLALLRRRRVYAIAVLAWLALLCGLWLYGWRADPDGLNWIVDGGSFRRGRLNSSTWKVGVILLAHSALLALTILLWLLREPRAQAR